MNTYKLMWLLLILTVSLLILDMLIPLKYFNIVVSINCATVCILNGISNLEKCICEYAAGIVVKNGSTVIIQQKDEQSGKPEQTGEATQRNGQNYEFIF